MKRHWEKVLETLRKGGAKRHGKPRHQLRSVRIKNSGFGPNWTKVSHKKHVMVGVFNTYFSCCTFLSSLFESLSMLNNFRCLIFLHLIYLIYPADTELAFNVFKLKVCVFLHHSPPNWTNVKHLNDCSSVWTQTLESYHILLVGSDGDAAKDLLSLLDR